MKRNSVEFLSKTFLQFLFLFLLITPLWKVHAATFSVISTAVDSHDVSPGDGMCVDSNNTCSLRASIEEANALAGVDTITLPAGTYTLTLGSELYISSELAVIGAGAETTIIQSNENPNTVHYRVLEINNEGNVAFTNLKIRNGVCDGTCPSGGNYGGGIYNVGTLVLDGVTISDNIATTYASVGGAVFNSGRLTIRNGSVIGGTGHGNLGFGGGGGIYNSGVGDITIDNSRVDSNYTESSGAGGGIYNDGGILTIQNHSVIDGNLTSLTYPTSGGGIFNFRGGTTTINASIVSNNTASYLGGGIYNNSTLNILNGSVIGGMGSGNTAPDGGGIINYGTTTVDASTLSANSSTGTANMGFGGGAVLNAGTLTVQNGSTIGEVGGGNLAAMVGGGIFNWAGGITTVTDSRILANSANASGGGIYNQSGGTVTVTNSCLVGNSITALDNLHSIVQTATGNWWGEPTGPGGVGSGDGDSVSTGWDYSGYLTSAPVGCPSLSNPTPTPTLSPSPTPTPTLSTTTLNPIADTYIKQGSQNENEGASTFLRLQSSGHNRALVKFSESAIEQAVNGNQNFTAVLTLTITDNGDNWGTNGRSIGIHRLITDWTEGNGFIDGNNPSNRGTGSGGTWNCATDTDIHNQNDDCSGITKWNMDNSSLWPFVSVPNATTIITNNQTGTINIDVTQDVQSFLSGTNSNYGWIIKKIDEGANGKVLFGSKESSYSSTLVITQH